MEIRSSLARISHTHGPKRTPRNRNLLTRTTVTREARISTDLTACRMGNTDFRLVAVKDQVPQVRHHARWRRRSGKADLWPVLPVGAGTAVRRVAGGSLPSAFTGRRHGARSAANSVCHSNVRITPNAGIPAEKEPPRNWGSFPPPAFGGLCRPEVGPVLPVGAPLPARRSAWWHGHHALVQRPRGAFCDPASAPEYEKSGLATNPDSGRVTVVTDHGSAVWDSRHQPGPTPEAVRGSTRAPNVSPPDGRRCWPALPYWDDRLRWTRRTKRSAFTKPAASGDQPISVPIPVTSAT